MKARPGDFEKPVRPNLNDMDVMGIGDEGNAEELGESGERLGLEEEDEVIRNLADPKLPTV